LDTKLKSTVITSQLMIENVARFLVFVVC